MEVNISGIQKIALLRALWEAQTVASFFAYQPRPKFSESEAEQVVTESYIDYFCGRPIKMDLSGDTLNPQLYDRDAGARKCASVVNKLKKK